MRTHRGLALVALLFVLGSGPALAAPEPPEHPWCGTRPGRLEEAIAVHRAAERQRARDPQALAAAALAGEAEAAQVGQVAVVSDPNILLQPKTLDLEGLGIQFVPQKKGGMRVSRVDGTLSDELGDRIALGDDDTRQIALPKGFRFPFHKKRYTSFFVQSDGNLTFGAGDPRSVARSLSNFAALPRIAPLYADLNPVDAAGEGGVYVNVAKDRVIVTWLAVPRFADGSSPGAPGPNTFQATLLKNGTITFAYGDLSTTEAVVGAGPGPAGNLTLLDFSHETPAGAIGGAIAERFSTELELDDLAIAKAFYRGFADNYDNLVVFLDFPFSLGPSAFAYQFHVKNDVQGIGLPIFDSSAAAGSKKRLRSFAQMGAVSRYPPNPAAPLLPPDSGLDIVAHETGHRWLAFVKVPGDSGVAPDILLGRQRAHWSYHFNSEASHLEGTRLADRGDGSFESTAESVHYSDLDRYLMGLLPPGAVPVSTYFYVADAQGTEREQSPQAGQLLRGHRVDVNIGELIAANGPRAPAGNRAQKKFGMAFVLVTQPGQVPSPQALATVEAYRAAWENYFPEATGGLGSVSTTLVQRRGRK
jgi:hypothetical protein